METKFIDANSLAFTDESRQIFTEFTSIASDLSKYKKIRTLSLVLISIAGIIFGFVTKGIVLAIAVVADIVVAILLGKKIKPLAESSEGIKERMVQVTLSNVIENPNYRSDISKEAVFELFSTHLALRGDYTDAENQISGYYNGKQFTSVDVHSFDVVKVDKHDKNEVKVKKGHVYAEGLITKTKFNRDINGTVALVPKSSMNFDLAFEGLDDIKMDNPEFEKVFSVKASDAVVAYSVLTAPYMETLLQLNNKYQGFFFEISGDDIVFGIPYLEKGGWIAKKVSPEDTEELKVEGYLDILEKDKFDEETFINSFVNELAPLNILYNELECGNDIYA